MIPIFATEKRAAELLDMDRRTFRGCVAEGILPELLVIGDQERWDVEGLKRAIRGEAPSEPEPTW